MGKYKWRFVGTTGSGSPHDPRPTKMTVPRGSNPAMVTASSWSPAYHAPMPRTAAGPLANITELVSGFVDAVERATVDRMKELVMRALGDSDEPPNGSAALLKVKRKPPKQLCPLPGCKNPAALSSVWSAETTRTCRRPRLRSTQRGAPCCCQWSDGHSPPGTTSG
jgi:hypothetical protein